MKCGDDVCFADTLTHKPFIFTADILAAESLQYTDPSSSRYTDVLFSLRDALVEKGETKWLTSVDNALANAFVRRKEWRLACAALDSMMESITVSVRKSVCMM